MTEPSTLPMLAAILPEISGVTVHRSALILPASLAYEDLARICWVLAELDDVATDSLPLWEADVLAHAEMVYGETYAQLLTLWPERALGTLRNRMWVGKRVPAAMRLEASPRGEVTYTACRIVASLPTAAQRLAVLKLAVAEDWTTREIEAYVRLCTEGESEPIAETLPAPPAEPNAPQVYGGFAALERAILAAQQALDACNVADNGLEQVGELLAEALRLIRESAP